MNIQRAWPPRDIIGAQLATNPSRVKVDDMIARIWHGTTKANDAAAYLQFLEERARPDYRTVEGVAQSVVPAVEAVRHPSLGVLDDDAAGSRELWS